MAIGSRYGLSYVVVLVLVLPSYACVFALRSVVCVYALPTDSSAVVSEYSV